MTTLREEFTAGLSVLGAFWVVPVGLLLAALVVVGSHLWFRGFDR